MVSTPPAMKMLKRNIEARGLSILSSVIGYLNITLLSISPQPNFMILIVSIQLSRPQRGLNNVQKERHTGPMTVRGHLLNVAPVASW